MTMQERSAVLCHCCHPTPPLHATTSCNHNRVGGDELAVFPSNSAVLMLFLNVMDLSAVALASQRYVNHPLLPPANAQ